MSDVLHLASAQGILLTDDEVAFIRNSSADSHVVRWAKQNIKPSCLLSAEELNLNNRIKDDKDKLLPQQLRNWTSLPQSEAELFDATKCLNASTSRLSAQTRALEFRQSVLSTLHPSPPDASQAQPPWPRRIQQFQSVTATSTQQTQLSNDAKVAGLEQGLRDRLERLDKFSRGAVARVSESLKADDRVLESVQCLLYPTEALRSEDGSLRDAEDQLQRVEQLATALERMKVQALKDRLDRVYLNSLLHRHQEGTAEVLDAETRRDVTDADNQVPEIKQDIQALYDEIEDVVTMLVEEEHMNALRLKLGEMQREKAKVELGSLRCAAERIKDLRLKVEAMADELDDAQSQKLVLAEMSSKLYDIKRKAVDMGRSRDPRRGRVDGEDKKATSDLARHLSTLRATPAEEDSADDAGRRHDKRLKEAAEARISAIGLLSAAATPAVGLQRQLERLDGRIAQTKENFEQMAREAG